MSALPPSPNHFSTQVKAFLMYDGFFVLLKEIDYFLRACMQRVGSSTDIQTNLTFKGVVTLKLVFSLSLSCEGLNKALRVITTTKQCVFMSNRMLLHHQVDEAISSSPYQFYFVFPKHHLRKISLCVAEISLFLLSVKDQVFIIAFYCL